ncbi:very-long-chain enoyl-CoA reductase isoform X2 [Hydra vulgaris]|uniref:Very-long-chain enoyl-CoA reductase isoform X2 n=1 Tax=Hydra vulgaris TaxID=6087 RepID=A0ABM4BIH1_HYDVU
MKVELLNATTKAVLITFDDLSIYTSVGEIKELYRNVKPHLYPSRQAFRIEPRGPIIDDKQTLQSLKFDSTARFYFKDLGPQVQWKTVFLVEYAGPLFVYLIFYLRPSIIYGVGSNAKLIHENVHLACGCFMFHYVKRLLETQFVHRFSHGTMPIGNLFKNCTYYWGFTALVAYFINHPLYTPATYGYLQVYTSLFGFLFCELGNYSIHVALKNLRPEGSKERKIPHPTSNPFTWLFHLVSCPNYTYEIGSWVFFTIMTQTLTSGLFTLVGAAQMTVWALKKQKAYKREFKEYPRRRKSIFPFLL